MLGQAAAMLVSFPTFFTSQFSAHSLALYLGEICPLTRPTSSSFGHTLAMVGSAVTINHGVLFPHILWVGVPRIRALVVVGEVMVDVDACGLVRRYIGVASSAAARSCRCKPVVWRRESFQRRLIVASYGCRYRCQIARRVRRHAFTAGNTVSRIDGAKRHRVSVVPRSRMAVGNVEGGRRPSRGTALAHRASGVRLLEAWTISKGIFLDSGGFSP